MFSICGLVFHRQPPQKKSRCYALIFSAMLVLRKFQNALQNTINKSATGRARTASIPLHQLTHADNDAADLRPRHIPAPVLPAEIWFLVLGLLDHGGCVLCKHKLLCTLALVCRVFNNFATKALYQTLDLRFSGGCNVPHECLKENNWYPKPHITKEFLRSKLDRLDRTLRLPQGPVLLIRHLKLPNVNITKYPGYAQNFLDILPEWVVMFELCSSRLESVSGLGNLWSYLHRFDRPELRTRVCDAIGSNPNWTEWDWLGDSWENSWTEEPRIPEMYRGWKNIRHVSIDAVEWATNVLSFLPELYSLSIECGGVVNDFRGIFQQVPLKGLSLLSIEAWIPPQQAPTKYDHTEPLNPLIDYLERCRLQPGPSQNLTTSALTDLEITCCWPGTHSLSSQRFYPKEVCLDEFLFSVFTLAPLLRVFKIDLRTPHERELGPADHPLEGMAHQCTSFVAQNLQSMTISIPSGSNKTWLAAKIASGAFPKLSSFVFRSAMIRRGLNCKTMFCNCTLDSSSRFLALNDFGREQDTALVQACQQAGVREWEMQIWHINSVWSAILGERERKGGVAFFNFVDANWTFPRMRNSARVSHSQ